MLEGLILIVVGLLQLFLGRRLFWLFVGLSGFLLGFTLAARLLPDQSSLIQLLIGVLLGLVFGGLAIALQRLMASVAGFIALGGVGSLLASAAGLGDPAPLIGFIILGLIGAYVIFAYYDWGLITISALNGASAFLSGLSMLIGFPLWVALLLGVGLAIVGVIFQGRDYRGRTLTTA
jgi:hypothetical protein